MSVGAAEARKKNVYRGMVAGGRIIHLWSNETGTRWTLCKIRVRSDSHSDMRMQDAGRKMCQQCVRAFRDLPEESHDGTV